jgi:ADP-heptose:LPS heptosyltransferase
MRILVIRRGAIGDTVVTLPTLEILRRNYPDAYIEVIGNPEYWEIAHKRYYVDAISAGETKLTPELYLKNGKIGKEVSDYFSSFDLIIAYISDPERTVSENLRKTGAKRVLTHPPFPKGDDLHAADYTALILQETGLSFNPPLFPKIHLNEEDLDFAHEFLYPFMQYRPLIAIHPRTFGIKGLPIGKFINIGKWIENTMGGKTIWITGQAEEENIDLIKSNFPSSPLLHLYSLSKVSATLSLSNLYFGCDTGISHLAAAAGARVLALFGPTNPHVWGPRGKRVWIIKADEMSTFEEYKVKDIIIFIYNKSKEVEENKIYSYQELLNAT